MPTSNNNTDEDNMNLLNSMREDNETPSNVFKDKHWMCGLPLSDS